MPTLAHARINNNRNVHLVEVADDGWISAPDCGAARRNLSTVEFTVTDDEITCTRCHKRETQQDVYAARRAARAAAGLDGSV